MSEVLLLHPAAESRDTGSADHGYARDAGRAWLGRGHHRPNRWRGQNRAGKVYRRFRDRNALYRVALLDMLEGSADQVSVSEHSGEQTLEAHVHRIGSLTLQQYRSRPGLMRALTRFIESDSDGEFRTRALRSISTNYERLADRLLAYRDRILNPDPHKAVIFALLTMGTVIEVRAFGAGINVEGVDPLDR